jgi:signal peptidase I
VSKRRLAFPLTIAAVIVLSAAFFVYTRFFVWMVGVPTGAMLNTIVPGDRLVVHKLFGNPNRGDIVAFQYPGDKAYYIARIIGLPGESIQLKGKLVYVNGAALAEQRVMVDARYNGKEPLKELSTSGSGPYRVYYVQHSTDEDDLSSGVTGDFGVDTPFQIPNDSYFIMGDNRDNSEDSRYRGAVPRNLIWGKPSIIYYSESNSDRVFTKVR